MGRAPCCTKIGMHRGPWTATEDQLLIRHIQTHGEGHWRSLPKKAGLLRCGKSCRLRWMNYLRPGIKRGNITPDEDDLIIRLHSLLGNRWSLIAGRLPGRTDNEIKNYWNSHLSKRFTKKVDDQNTQTKVVKGENQSENDETKKSWAKVHQPRAVRVSRVSPIARNCSPKVDVFGGAGNNEAWLQENEFICSSSTQSFMPTNEDDDDMMELDDIFDDCGNLDSFIDSLLA